MAMAELGNCLLFYLKYPAEMKRLYETDEPAMDEFPNPDGTLEKIKRVGDAACWEAAELLKACASAIKNHFGKLVSRRRGKPDSTWTISFWALPEESPKNCEIGITLITGDPPALQPWIWCRGGRAAESKMLEALKSVAKQTSIRRGAEIGWSNGCILLGRIGIEVPNDLRKGVAREPLVAQAQNVFQILTEDHVKKLAAISGTK
jgi:hypothetical protein